MAEQCGFPASVISDARSLQRAVTDAFPTLLHSQAADKTLYHIQGLSKQLLLLQNSNLCDEALNGYLSALRSSINEQQTEHILRYIDKFERDCNMGTCSARATIDACASASVGASVGASASGNVGASASVGTSVDAEIELPGTIYFQCLGPMHLKFN